MKKYTTLNTDCSTLVPEVMAYLNNAGDVEDVDHVLNAFHIIPVEDLSGTSVDSTFDGFTTSGVIHCTVNGDAMFKHSFNNPFILIPLEDCEDVVVNFYNVADGAVLQPTRSYLDADCTLANTIPLTSPIVIDKSVTFNITKSDMTKLGDTLMLWFNEDVTTYLA